jgi:hypothetical protein
VAQVAHDPFVLNVTSIVLISEEHRHFRAIKDRLIMRRTAVVVPLVLRCPINKDRRSIKDRKDLREIEANLATDHVAEGDSE